MSKKSALQATTVEAISRFNMRDMLIAPELADTVLANMVQFANSDPTQAAALELTSREAIELAYGFDSPDDDTRKPFVYQDGVAVIPIHGTLLNRCNWSWGFITGYNYIRRMLNAALDDDDVETIVFDVDSPGGEAAGCFELAREIMASRRVKPSLAMVDSLAASGGMALAGCATLMYAIPSARVGSIGVYRQHISYEDNLKQAGIKVTFATAGEHKIDGNPYEDLPAAVLKEWRESAEKTWDDFIALVAEARDMSEDDVRATQARVYRADEALAKGLINAVKTPTEAVAAFLAELAEATPFEDEEENTMADAKKEVTSGLTEDDLTKIASMIGTAVGGVATSIARQTAIKDHAASKGQAALGAKLAANAAISEADAIDMIDAAAGNAAPAKAKGAKGKQKVAAGGDEDEGDEDGDDDDSDDSDDGDEDGEEAARSRRKQGRDNVNHLDVAMGKTKKPNVGGGSGKEKGEGDQPSTREKAGGLLADHARVTGSDWSQKAGTALNS